MFCHVEYAHTDSVEKAIRLTGERINASKIRPRLSRLEYNRLDETRLD